MFIFDGQFLNFDHCGDGREDDAQRDQYGSDHRDSRALHPRGDERDSQYGGLHDNDSIVQQGSVVTATHGCDQDDQCDKGSERGDADGDFAESRSVIVVLDAWILVAGQQKFTAVSRRLG